MSEEISAAIKRIRAEIQAEKDAIAVHQHKISELSLLITKYLKEKKKNKLSRIDFEAKKSLDVAAQDFVAAVKRNNFCFHRIEMFLCRKIDDFIFSTKLTKKLHEAQCYFVWQAAIHTREYWEKALSWELAHELESNLVSKGITLGLDYVCIMLALASHDDN